MTVSIPRSSVLAAAMLAASFAAAPAFAASRDGGVSVTITKQPSYLNTRTTPSAPASYARDTTSAVYQPFYNQSNSVAFGRPPLPSTFSIPGY